MTRRYREMTIDDLPATFAVRLSTVENAITMEELERDYAITPDSLAAAMAAQVRGWLCEEAGTVVGFAMGDGANGEVQVVAVRPEYEAKGIGKALLARVRDWLFLQGYREVWLRANPDPGIRAHGFYRRLGWRATGRMVGDDEIMVLRNAETTRPAPAEVPPTA